MSIDVRVVAGGIFSLANLLVIERKVGLCGWCFVFTASTATRREVADLFPLGFDRVIHVPGAISRSLAAPGFATSGAGPRDS